MQLDPQPIRLNPEQVQVKQRVNVGPKEKAVLGVVVLFAAVRLDVRRLQHRENCAIHLAGRARK